MLDYAKNGWHMDKFLRTNVHISDFHISFIYFVLTVLTRIPFHISKYLYEWDSVNYALSIEEFDISQLKPHPPGYILFVLLVKLVNVVALDANNTQIIISIIFSGLTVGFTYFLGKNMFNRTIGILSASIVLFNPIFWFYGVVATIYPCEGFFALLIAYFSYKLLELDNESSYSVYYPAIVLGIASGMRQNIVLFMGPLIVFCIFTYTKSILKLVKVIMFIIIASLLWFIPTIYFTGGFIKYLELTGERFSLASHGTSILFGAGQQKYLAMVSNFIRWHFIGSWITLLLFSIYIFINIKYIGRLFLSFIKTSARNKVIFFILWILPAFIFYLLIHIPKPGYIMTYLPAICIMAGYLLFCLIKDRIYASLQLILILLFISGINIYFFVMFESEVSIKKIYSVDKRLSSSIQDIEQYMNYESDSSPIVYIGSNYRPSWRHVMYYLPQIDIINPESKKYVILSRKHSLIKLYDRTWCPTRVITKLIWIADKENSNLILGVLSNTGLKDRTKEVRIMSDNNEKISYISDLSDAHVQTTLSNNGIDFGLFKIVYRDGCSSSIVE